MDSRVLPCFFALLLLSALSFAYLEYNGALYCNTTCDDCEDALNNATYDTVYLNSSLSSPGATCINNPAGFTNKTFDCQGNTITGSGSGTGIYMDSRNNVTLLNCTVSSFSSGVQARYMNASLFEHLTLSGHGNTAFVAYYLARSTIANSTFCNGSHEGIGLDYSDDNVIMDNEMYNLYQEGMELNGAVNNSIFYNLMYNVSTGVSFHYLVPKVSQNNTVMFNSFYNNSGGSSYSAIGLWQDGGSENTIANNTMEGNSYDIWMYQILESDCNNLIENNTGEGGLPVYFFNYSANLDGADAAQVILCNADGSTLTDVTIIGSPTRNNSGLWIEYTENAVMVRVDSSNNADGATLDSNSHNNTFLNCTFNGNEGYGIASWYGDNISIVGCTTSGNGYEGIDLYDTHDSIIENNTVSSNAYLGIVDSDGSDNTFRGNTIYGNEYTGIEIYNWGTPNTGMLIESNTLYGNKMDAIYLYGPIYNSTVTGNTLYSNGIGFTDPLEYVSSSYYPARSGLRAYQCIDLVVANNTIYNNGYYGIVLNESDNVSLSGDRVYGNGVADIYLGEAGTSGEVYLNNAYLHTSNYPNVSIYDALEANTAYTIKQAASPSTSYPASLTAVRDRILNITNITGSPTIDSLIMAWGLPEQGDYNESTFDLWRYVTSWVDLNATSNPTSNTINYSSVITQGSYGILGVYTYEEDEDGGNDVECTEDSDCGECEVCSGGACELPSGACLDDGDCTGEGETCVSCECIPPECVEDSDCAGEGETCINYECIPPECLEDTDCPGEGETCENYECTAPECATDADCASMGEGYACTNYVCTAPECTTNEDCAACYECTDYACILPGGSCLSDSACITQYGQGYACSNCECIPPAYECTYDEDCPGEGHICSSHVCYAPECLVDDDCGACYECSDYSCDLPAGSCGVNSDCLSEGAGYSCVSCSCTPPECVNDGECTREGEVCENYVCVPPSCVEDNDCPGGYTCSNYKCNAPECFYNDDCADNQICKNYACMNKKEERPSEGSPRPTEEVEEPEEVEVEGSDEEGVSPSAPPFVSEAIDSIAGIFFTTTDAPAQGAGEGGQVQVQQTQLSIVGWFFAIVFAGIIFYFILGRLLPRLPGGKS